MTKENKRRLAIMRWMKKVLRVVVGILTFGMGEVKISS